MTYWSNTHLYFASPPQGGDPV